MKSYDFAEGDSLVVDGILHYFIDQYKYELLEQNFPGRKDLNRALGLAGYNNGIECDMDVLDVLATNDKYAVFHVRRYLGAYITDKRLFDEYLTIVDILPGDPPVSQESVPSLSESVLDLLESVS